MERTEHYDWNDGWLFTPQFDPSLLEPDCSGLELEPVRLPHTVKSLPFNYCNENDYQMIRPPQLGGPHPASDRRGGGP